MDVRFHTSKSRRRSAVCAFLLRLRAWKKGVTNVGAEIRVEGETVSEDKWQIDYQQNDLQSVDRAPPGDCAHPASVFHLKSHGNPQPRRDHLHY